MKKNGIIKSVEKCDGGWYVDIDKSCSFFLNEKYGVEPKVGNLITLYTKNLSIVRGVDINLKKVFYKTDEELDLEHQQWCDNYEKEKQDAFEKNKLAMDVDYEALPDNFKKRINRFRANNPKFRVDYERYELFCCKEALKIAAYCKTVDKVEEFRDLSCEEKAEIIDARHSNATFGAACYLAFLHLLFPEDVWKMHGALSPLVGSKEYGDCEK